MSSRVDQNPHADLIAVRDALSPLTPGPSWGNRIANFILREEPEKPLPPPQLTDATPMWSTPDPTKWECLIGVIKAVCYAILISPFGSKTRNLKVLVGQASQPVVLHEKQGSCKFCSAYLRTFNSQQEAQQQLSERQQVFTSWLSQAHAILTQNYSTQSSYTNASRFVWMTGIASGVAFYHATPMLAIAALVASTVAIVFLIHRAAQRWNEQTTLSSSELDSFFAEPNDDVLSPGDDHELPLHEPTTTNPAAPVADPHTSEHAPSAQPPAPLMPASEEERKTPSAAAEEERKMGWDEIYERGLRPRPPIPK